jgi:flavin-dependent dehydrogenase
MPEVTIVGAGLSGLVAAINLARDGRQVTVLERESRIGGMPEFRPDPAGSPFDLDGIKRYTGVDVSPATKVIEDTCVWAWGKRFVMPMRAAVKLYMVERGSRESALDTLLFKEATALGVNFEFGRPIITQGEYAQLPPDTIIATGLQMEVYEALCIPYSPLYGYFAKGTVDHDRTTVAMYFDDFTRDYGWNCTINGVSFAILFQRDMPLRREGMEKFREMVRRNEGMKFSNWKALLGGACPVGSIKNPRLFHGNKILAGTLSGVIDPFLFFGMLGALVSGRIAATAIEDKGLAWQDFQRATRTFYPTYLAKKAFSLVPDPARRSLMQAALKVAPRVEDLAMTRFAGNIPGWRLL